jgi:hypothetical protein
MKCCSVRDERPGNPVEAFGRRWLSRFGYGLLSIADFAEGLPVSCRAATNQRPAADLHGAQPAGRDLLVDRGPRKLIGKAEFGDAEGAVEIVKGNFATQRLRGYLRHLHVPCVADMRESNGGRREDRHLKSRI